MEVVFEIVNRAGHALERHRAYGRRVTIGRAYDNDLILPDATVCPHHAALETNEAGDVRLVDLDSLNGIRVGAHQLIDKEIVISSGEAYSFGRARVRIYEPNHPVAGTLPIGGLDAFVNRLGNRRILGPAIAVAVAMALGEQWLNTYTDIEWQEMSVGAFGVLLVSLSVALLWAIVGRIIKHEARLRTHLTLVVLYILAQSVIVYGYEVALFNTLDAALSTMFGLVLSFALLCTYFWLALHIATNLSSQQGLSFAGVFSAVVLCISMYPEILKQTKFSESPSYIDIVKPPYLRINEGDSLDAYIDNAVSLFSTTNHNDD